MNLHPIHAQYYEQRKRPQRPEWAQKLMEKQVPVSIDAVINAHSNEAAYVSHARRQADNDVHNLLSLIRLKRRRYERENAQRSNPDPLRPMIELQADLCRMVHLKGPGYSPKRRALCIKYARIISVRICELQRERSRC